MTQRQNQKLLDLIILLKFISVTMATGSLMRLCNLLINLNLVSWVLCTLVQRVAAYFSNFNDLEVLYGLEFISMCCSCVKGYCLSKMECFRNRFGGYRNVGSEERRKKRWFTCCSCFQSKSEWGEPVQIIRLPDNCAPYVIMLLEIWQGRSCRAEGRSCRSYYVVF